MKKLLITTVVVSSLISPTAFAKTGHSLGLEVSNISVDQEFGNSTFLGSDDAALPTLRYGYKADFDQFFIRPSASYTIGDIEMRHTNHHSNKTTLSQILTVEGDLGYNITNKIGIFGTIGLQHANLKIEEVNYEDDASTIGLLIGLGLEYNITDSINVNARYQHSSLAFGVENVNDDIEVDTDAIKIGVSYNF